ncbi:hypothetical protein HPO96_18590 [Kribbella sandramycini]|uniref:Uncharacterized protein n=1 Tax=Kribbella sandramycini TaxID=60450 RepID=A0A7Y4P0U5_9ACTN|nr:hypothetical protein [Kribbella sandramycini]MBB6564554.1 hypothetical protein [Kribbella sandramycini]NOL42258.1 hypothetical protein [Kribbella sandramycini]
MADRFDLDAIDADDALLDLLAAGGESARFAGEHDPAVALLAELRLAVEVEDELPEETIDDAESFLARCAALNPVTDPFARKMAARGLALGVAAVAALSVSGVAAAVTGDPLSPYEKVIEKITDAVSPTTDFPKEQLEGLPVVDKTTIVKVAKDYQKKQEQKAAEAKAGEDKTLANGEVPQDTVAVMPPLARPAVITNPTVIEQPVVPPPTTTTQPPTTSEPQPGNGDPTDKPSDPVPSDPPPSDPPPTTEPTPPPTTEPTTPPTTPPTTEPSTPPTTPAPGNGENGNPGTQPSTQPTGDTGTNPNENPGENPNPGNPGLPEQPGSDTGETGDTEPGDTPTLVPTPDAPSGDVKPVEDEAVAEVEKLVKAIAPVLPTPTGAPVELRSAEKYFGKHSSGKVASGSVRKAYTKGKHSSGKYVEGKHAAIERTHGSVEDEAVLQILGVLNNRPK